MLLTLLVGLGLALSAPPHEGPEVRKEIQFIGFSRDEGLCAFTINVHKRHRVGTQDVVDKYSTIAVVDSDTRNIRARFRAKAPSRYSATAPYRRLPAPTLAQELTDWQTAAPNAVWQRLKQRARFHGKRLEMNNSTVRLRGDANLAMEMKAEEKAKDVLGTQDQAVGFTPVARLMDGALMDLGHFRMEGRPGTIWRAKVEVYHSYTARHVAVITRFFPQDEPTQSHSLATVAYTGKEPLGTTAVGSMQMMDIYTRHGSEIFEDMYPELTEMWRFYVGHTW